MNIRLIPRLDIKGPNLVKGIHFEGLRVLGKPEDFAAHYYKTGADELFYQDAVASLYNRNSLLDIVARTAKKIFIPLTVGGGIRTLDDINNILRAGGDKVAINTEAINDPGFITKAAQRFGSSTIVVSIEAIKTSTGYMALTNYGREPTDKDAVEWAKQAVQLGAGELMVTAVHNEGTGKGFDTKLISEISAAVPIPVIAGGGAGNVEHVLEAVKEGKADAVSLASILHYDYIKEYRATDKQYQNEGNIEFLRKGRGFSKVQGVSILEVKQHLINNNIQCRLIDKEDYA